MPRCETCSSFALIDGSTTVFTHHPNIRALASSAALGCELCQFLYKQLNSSSSPVRRSLDSWIASQTIDSSIRLYRIRGEVSSNELQVQVGSEEKNRIPLLICSKDGQCYGISSWKIIMELDPANGYR